jgi:hypothetical protein
MELMGTQTLLLVFRPPKLHVLVSRPRFVEGHPFEFGFGGRLV